MPELTTDQRAELLKLYDGLRVCDVRDGLDWHMLQPLTAPYRMISDRSSARVPAG